MPDTHLFHSRVITEWMLLLVGLTLLGCALGYHAYDEYQDIRLLEEQRLATLTSVVQQQVERQFSSIAKALDHVRDRYPKLMREPDGLRHLTDEMTALADAMPGARVLMLIDASGRVRASTRAEVVGRDFSERIYFKAARAKPEPRQLFISAPFRNTFGDWTVVLVRVLHDPASGFGGIVFASLEPRELGDMLEATRYEKDAWAAVIHVDGRIYVVRPEAGELSQSNVLRDPDSPFSRHHASGQDSSLQTGSVPDLSGESLVALRTIWVPDTVMDKSLMVAVGRPLTGIYRSWRHDNQDYVLAFVIIALLATTTQYMMQRRRRVWEVRVAQDEQRFREIFDAASDAIYIHDAESGRILDVNRRMLEMYGVSREQVLASGPNDLSEGIPPYSSAEATEKLRLAIQQGPQTFEWRARGANDRLFWVEVSLRIATLGGETRVIAVVRDISDRKQAEMELRIAAAAFESNEGTVVTDANGVVLRINKAFTEITGYSPEDITGRTTALLKSGRHDEAFYREMWQSIREHGCWQGEIWDRRKDGTIYPKWLMISSVYGETGEVTHYIGTHYDITNRKADEEKINSLAYYDQLTGLPNRTLVLDRLSRAMARGERSGDYSALLFIDLDNFKTLNDTQGHEVGDLLLKEVANRLRQCVREEDTAARQGGDEFLVVLSGLGRQQKEAATAAEAVGEKILAALHQPYQLVSVTHHCSASIGVTMFQGHSVSIDELMKQADLAMYKAKAAGHDTVRFFDPDMEALVQSRARLEGDLRYALDLGQFLLHYQPQVEQEGRVVGVEALVRWQHSQRGMVSPADFIPLAEETNLILPLGDWVLETACRTLANWAKHPATATLVMAVNVSNKQFRQASFVDKVLSVLAETGAPPGRLKLELTESIMADNVEHLIGIMNCLRATGISFSLDDFGTGYSSLAYLKLLPLDQLKIDQSFVRDILTDTNDAAIACTIMALAKSLGLDVIAEGVETLEQQRFLAAHGCQAYQGYLFSRPVPLDELGKMLPSD